METQKKDVFDPVGHKIQTDPGCQNVINLDFTDIKGKIRRINGVNSGPLSVAATQDSDLTAWWEVLHIPTARLHDTPLLGSPDTVDIHCIFPDFRADPEEPASYHFKRTDKYIKAIVDLGVQVVYRLGESIDNSADKHYIDPPADYEKWAGICLGIIRHYNDGWADGFHYGIKYWEIWNEPEQSGMWTGTHQQYCDLYGVAAKAIKKHDPTLKVGGPSSSGSVPLQTLFLAYCRDNNIPLDFYSSHCYTATPLTVKNTANRQIKQLREFGFDKAEYHLNEWHYFKGDWGQLKNPFYATKLFERANGPVGAAFAASALIMLQDTETSMMNYYTGNVSSFGLFDSFRVPRKTYYAFKAFAWLLEMPDRVSCDVHDYQIEAAAGIDKEKRAALLLLSNCTDEQHDCVNVNLKKAPFPGAVSYEIYAVDENYNLDQIERRRISTENKRFVVECPPATIRVIKFFWK